ncbi:MAG: hypothetical protein KAH84_08730 [Thiomargarita sp.]|nr:hypothetical protein [Thiomargarita sp.]
MLINNKCEKQANLKEWKKARKLVLNLIYGDLSNQNAYEMQKWLIIINNKSKTCDNAEELMKYCENIGIRTNICESIQ